MTIPAVEEVGRALEVAPAWFRPFIAVCAFAGLRLGGAAALRLEDVDFLRRTVSVRHQLQGETNRTTELVAPKSRSERVVYVPADLVDLLAEHVQRIGVPHDHWLVSNGPLPLDRNSAGHRWREVGKAAGIEGYPRARPPALLRQRSHRLWLRRGDRAAGARHSSATITLGVYSRL